MRWRILCLATAAGIGVSLLVGLVVGIDLALWPVQELVARIIPGALDDGRFWQSIDSVVVAILAAPGIVLAVCVYAWRQRAGEGETRCRKCGYILRGITEPRCTECGERI